MVGGTNAVIGSGGWSAFSATLQVATDANAVITAVNLAGDTFSGMANSSGALNLTITEPGTYTITETGGSDTKSIVIADNGATYTLTIYAFDGTLVLNGVPKVQFQTYNVQGSTAPTVTNATVSGENAILVYVPNSNIAQYRTNDLISPVDYSYITIRGLQTATAMVVAVDSNNTITSLGQLSSTLSTTNFSLSSLDQTKRYRFGVHGTGGTYSYIVNIKLQ